MFCGFLFSFAYMDNERGRMMEEPIFGGRRVLSREVEKYSLSIEEKADVVINALTILKKEVICQRCKVATTKAAARLNEQDFYCPHCLFLGRCDTTQKLILVKQPDLPPRKVVFDWQGTLTKEQAAIAQKLNDPKLTQDHLIWAVTGAGKTEMLYPLLLAALSSGGRAAVVSPRVDVCIELHLRFSKVFPEEKIGLFHGKESWDGSYHPFVVCTTHQLYRFYQAFDVLVVDEIDAFPYAGDKGLASAVQTALKKTGKFIYLSATPDEKLRKQTEGLLVHQLPLRFHRRPLPEPELFFWNHWRRNCLKKRKAKRFLRLLLELKKQNDLLLFCPTISLMLQLEKQLKNWLPELTIGSVSSEDEQRAEKVAAMREKAYDILLTSTILERGVTFERLSVVVLGADHQVFTKAALVQIAGRADRKGGYTNSRVCFFYHEKTAAIQKAVQEIQEMNKKGALLR
jgi:competence protein ComFA